MADPPGSHSHTSLQMALDEHLAALQQQQQQQQLQQALFRANLDQSLNSIMNHSNPPASNPCPPQQQQQPNNASIANAVAQFLAQQQPQPQPVVTASSNVNNDEHGLLRALQQQQQQQQQPLQQLFAAPAPPQPSPMDNALVAVLRASNTADMAGLDELSIRQALSSVTQQQPPPPPPPQPTQAQDALTLLLSNPAGLAETLETLRVRANLLGGMNALRPEDLAAAIGGLSNSNTATPSASPAAVGVVPEPEDQPDEEIPIPELPKVRPLPPLEEGETPHWSKRTIVPLATEEDANWLSERQCFIRAELLEVVRASHQDVLVRSSSKSVAYQQVGIRCRYCAHFHPSARAIRSSAYPSSIRQMYQSFTMMVRDHWAGCTGLPPTLKKRFLQYQEHKIPSSSLSREYWAYAANKIGMINTEYGITITEESLADAEKMNSFGTTKEHVESMANESRKTEALVHPSDQAAISPYLYLLMDQVELCYLLETERVGKRKAAPVGLTGFGCKNCIKVGRLGFCRVFPLNKRSLPTKVNDLYTHFQRCALTPVETRRALRQLRHEYTATKKPSHKFAERDREFVDQIWTKLGRKGAQIGPMG